MVDDIQYHHFPGTTVIVACMEIENNYHVICHSACANPASFSVEVGKSIARSRCLEAAKKVRASRGLDASSQPL